LRYFFLVWGALRRRPARTLLTVFSIITAFFLFGTLQGVNVGITKIMDVLDTAHLRVMSRVDMNTPMPLAHVARIAALPGVTGVTGLSFIVGSYQRPNNLQIVLGVDFKGLSKAYSEVKIPPEQLAAVLRTRSGAIVGIAAARRQGWKIGDRIPIHSFNVSKSDGTSDWVFDVVGFYELERYPADAASQVFANFDYINEARSSGKNAVNQILVGIADAHRSAQISQEIDDMFANSPNQTLTQNEKDFIQGLLRQIGDISFLVNAIVGAVLFTLLFLTANTIAQSVRERVAELAVLKTVGFTDTTVQLLVLLEALIVCVFAAVIGLALAAFTLPLVSSFPGLGLGAMHVPRVVFLAGLGVAVLLALASGIPPAQRARRLNIVAALSGR